MKKILAVVVMYGLLSVWSVSYAQINKRVDPFDGTVRIYSIQQNVDRFVQFNFFNVIDSRGSHQYRVFAATNTLKNYNFSKNYAEIKIDQIIYKSDIIATEDYDSTDNGRYPISVKIQIPSDAIDSLKTAQKVILRFHRENGYQDIAEVPSDVLEEWKEVIATEK